MIFNRVMRQQTVKQDYRQKAFKGMGYGEWCGSIHWGIHLTIESGYPLPGSTTSGFRGVQRQHAPAILPDENETSRAEVIILDGMWDFSTKDPNVMKLDEWVYKTRDWHAMDEEGITGTPGQVNSYTAIFEVIELPEGEVRLVLDHLKQWKPSHVGFLSRKRSLEIYINNKKVETLKQSCWQEKQFLEAKAGELLVKNTSKITIHTISHLNPMHSLVEPAYLVGNFMLRMEKISKNSGKISGIPVV